MDNDERRKVEDLIETLREETARLKEQVDGMRALHERSRERFLQSDAILRRHRQALSSSDNGGGENAKA